MRRHSGRQDSYSQRSTTTSKNRLYAARTNERRTNHIHMRCIERSLIDFAHTHTHHGNRGSRTQPRGSCSFSFASHFFCCHILSQHSLTIIVIINSSSSLRNSFMTLCSNRDRRSSTKLWHIINKMCVVRACNRSVKTAI